MIAQYAVYVMGAVLIVAIGFELRSGKIPNWLTLVPFVLFIAVAATTEDRSVLVWQLVLAVSVFAVGLLLFAFLGFGAGAVKLMAGLALFIPTSETLAAIVVFFITLFLTGLIVIQLRKSIGDDSSDWHVLRARTMPMSLPLAMTGFSIFFLF